MSGDHNLTCTRHLGGTIHEGSTMSGTHYASHSFRKPHTMCWIELAVFGSFPNVPSLAGTMVQCRQDLMASTSGAGRTVCPNMILEFELFDDESPKTCANFRRLCAGQSTSRQGQTYQFQGLTPSYRGTYFHKIVPKFCAQGGDLTMRVDGGANHFSSAGRGWFADENKKRRHNEAGLLSMANNGPNSNGSQFFITTSASEERAFNGRHVCFGRVSHGLDTFLSEVAPFGTVEGHPSRYAVVVDCGEGPAPSYDLETTQEAEAADVARAPASAPGSARDVVAEAETHLDEEASPPRTPPAAPADDDEHDADADELKSAMKSEHAPKAEKHVTYQDMAIA